MHDKAAVEVDPGDSAGVDLLKVGVCCTFLEGSYHVVDVTVSDHQVEKRYPLL